MKRRRFGLLGASSALALSAGLPKPARAGVTAEQAAALKTTLTPMGSERAGNADGSIPAWTGGETTVMSSWTGKDNFYPDIFADDKPYLTVNAANMAQYADQLSVGMMEMMTKYGFSIDVYPTHRSAAMPQAVYDNIYQNALNTQTNPQGARLGFTGGYGGIPFPIINTDDPEVGGGQLIWNHLCRWFGYNYNRTVSSFSVTSGVPALGVTIAVWQENTFYNPGGTLANYDGTLYKLHVNYTAPSVYDGQIVIQIQFTNPLQKPAESWQLLPGQGRVRKAPELTYDTPAQPLAGIGNYDEMEGFFGAPDRYNWKLLGKKEMFIPYNNNGQFAATPKELLGPHFLNPQYTRFEKHRVWVVDATLAPGERNVVPHRRMYIDEDTWTIALADEWDAQGNIWRLNMTFLELRPDIPALNYGKGVLYNLQSDEYVLSTGPWSDASLSSPLDTSASSSQQFNPTALAAQSQF